MARHVSFRLMGAAALCSAAFVLAGAAPYLYAAPAAPGLSDPEPSMSVNHFRKGDRLPLFHPRAVRQEVPSPPVGSQTQGKVPLGCDSSFSPVTSPELATLYGRCMA
jgi:hypothetical protein